MAPRAERGALVLTALSARALAWAARRAGFLPFAADLFADTDLRRTAHLHRRFGGDPDRGPDPPSFHETLEALFAAARAETGAPALGLVYGSGIEAEPRRLLGPFAGRILGNPPALVEDVKNPLLLARLTRRLGIPHPRLSFLAAHGPGWLIKRRGGAGGGHVRFAAPGERPGAGEYLQAYAPGRPVSALFLADGTRARILFFSEQFPDPDPAHPFRYGGAVRPAALEAATAAAMAEAVGHLVLSLGLVGLNSADFLYRPPQEWVLLEINPRPGATLDLAPAAALALHVAACRGRLPPLRPPPRGSAGAAVLYAPAPLRIPARFVWPDWTRDRPPSGARIAAGAPLCTVLARGGGAESVGRLLGRRKTALLDLLMREGGGGGGAEGETA